MHKRYDLPGKDSKRGVALIVVLGFLSIMVMMAVAFLTQARMERLVAGTSADAQRGRQMARTALNAAMSDYSVNLYAVNRYMLPPPDSPFDLFLSKSGTASGEIQPAISGNNGTLAADTVELMKGEARNWIPRRYLADENYAMANAHWILVRKDPSKGAGKDNPVVGRYAYLCFDMSGGIDANLIALEDGVANVGNATNRNSVRNVGLGELAEMNPIQNLADKPPDASRFKRLRRGWHGFDTLSELILLTNGRYNGGENQTAIKYNGTDYYYIDEGVSAEELPPDKVWGPKGPRWRSGEGWTRIEEAWPALNPTNVSDLVPYSLATYRGWEYDPNKAKWKTDGLMAWDEHETWGASQWGTALGELKQQFEKKTIPDWWMDALTDYTQESVYPKGLDYPSPKNVPMINKVGLTVTPQTPAAGASSFQLDIELQVGVWYPFPAEDNKRTESFTINPVIGGSSTPSALAGVDLQILMIMEDTNTPPTRIPITDWEANPQTVSPPMPFNATPGLPKVMTFNYLAPINAPGLSFDINTWRLRIATTLGEGLEIQTGGQAVDRVPANVVNLASAAGMFLTWATPSGPFYWEVSDPRLNHLEEGAWQQGDGPMTGINKLAETMGYGTNGDSTNFYCRNAPMKSPVELGYFSTGTPWTSLEFCSKEGADALSRMVTRKIINDLGAVGVAYTNGTINPNTASSNVLRAAFARLKIKDNGGELDDTELDELVRVFQQITDTKKVTDTSVLPEFRGACMRGIDWIWANEFQPPTGNFARKWSKNERHRLIERTWGLFNPNNSMFTVLAIGQAIKEGSEKPGVWSEDDLVTGERRAVAMVWRDPTPPGLNKPHEMFVRVFKFLDE